MRLPATLYAERIEGYIRYRLEVPEHDVGLPLQQEFSHVLDEATVLPMRCCGARRRRFSPTKRDGAARCSTGPSSHPACAIS